MCNCLRLFIFFLWYYYELWHEILLRMRNYRIRRSTCGTWNHKSALLKVFSFLLLSSVCCNGEAFRNWFCQSFLLSCRGITVPDRAIDDWMGVTVTTPFCRVGGEWCRRGEEAREEDGVSTQGGSEEGRKGKEEEGRWGWGRGGWDWFSTYWKKRPINQHLCKANAPFEKILKRRSNWSLIFNFCIAGEMTWF